MAVIERPSEFSFVGSYFQNPIKFLISSANAFEELQLEKFDTTDFVNVALQKQRVIDGFVQFDISSISQNLVSNSLASFNTVNHEFDATATALVKRDADFVLAYNIANAVSNNLIDNNFEEYVYQTSAPANISLPQTNFKFFKGFPSYFTFYASDLSTGININISDASGLLENFTIPFRRFTTPSASYAALTKYYLDLFFQNPTSDIEIEIVGSSQTINFEYVDLGDCNTVCFVWHNELGALESFVFESYIQTRYSTIEQTEFFGSSKRIATDLRKVEQATSTIQPLVSQNDLDNILSLWTSNQVYLFDKTDNSFNPIQITNNAPTTFNNTTSKKIDIEFVRQIQNK